jgi:hypothetical protein
MKTRFGIFSICLLLVSLISAARVSEKVLISGQTLTELGQYKISTTDKAMKINDESLKTYELCYSGCKSPVFIGVKNSKQCKNFIVRSNNFEVEYVCKKHVFGVKRINKDYQTISTAVIDDMMDNADFFRQRIISQNPKTEEELLGLIACYFPSLLKDDKLAGI